MTLTALPYRPGVVKDDPDYTAKGWAIDSQWVRAVSGYFQSQGGWEKRLTQQFNGIARGEHEWTRSDNVNMVAFGTNTKLYLVISGWIANITPARASGALGLNPVTTSIGSSTVNITHANHGLISGATAFLGNAGTVNNITLGPSGAVPNNKMSVELGSNLILINWATHGLSTGQMLVMAGSTPLGGINPDGTYLIHVIDTNYIQVYSATTATSNASAGGGAPAYYAMIPYTATYVDANNYTITASTVASASGAGGGAAVAYLYEINPGRLYGSFGTGWSSGGYSTGGYGSASGSGVSPRDAAVWCLDNYGDDLLASRIGTTIYRHQGNWSQRAQVLTNAPDEVEWFVVTPNRTVMAFGCTDADTGDFDALLIRFTDSLDPTIWDIDLTNNAGDLRVGQGSRLIAGLVALDAIFAWTDVGIYKVNFVGNYEQMYRADILGVGYGLLGPLAMETLGDSIYWCTTEKSFAYFNGGAPKGLPCKSQTWFGNQLSPGQNFKVFCFHDTQYSAVSWGFATDPTQEITGYIRLDISEADQTGAGGWSVGTFSRSGWNDAHSLNNPLGWGLDGYIYNQETGNGDNGSAMTRFIEWAPFDMMDGDRVMNVNRMVFDFLINSGTLQAYLYMARWPNGTVTTKGPYSLTSNTLYNRVRAQGRQMGLKLISSTTNDDWRAGIVRGDLTPGPRR